MNNEEQLKKCEAERDEYLNGWKRAKADLINYKKEEAQRFNHFAEFSQAEVMRDMVAILDSFSLATDLSEGAIRIRKQMEESLKRNGLEEIAIPPSQAFDPALHEAIKEEESDQPPGTIIEEFAKGYTLNGRVLRPAKVKVAKHKE